MDQAESDDGVKVKDLSIGQPIMVFGGDVMVPTMCVIDKIYQDPKKDPGEHWPVIQVTVRESKGKLRMGTTLRITESQVMLPKDVPRPEEEKKIVVDTRTGQVAGRRRHDHYFKSCSYEHVDVYRVLRLFNVVDPCLQHAIKKLMVAGGRGAGKDINKDIQEAIDSLNRWQEMQKEDYDIKINPPA